MIRQEFPVLELGWVPLISLPPPELRGLSRFEISKYRNFQYSNYESEKKTKMQQIHVMKVFFLFRRNRIRFATNFQPWEPPESH